MTQLNRITFLFQHQEALPSPSYFPIGKLLRPQPSPDCLVRPHLLQRLTLALQKKLTLVMAPAGYGKSTLVAQWLNMLESTLAEANTSLQAADVNPIWLQLSETDHGLSRFTACLAYALDYWQPGHFDHLLASLKNAAADLAPELVAELFLQELAKCPNHILLILDDFHTITHGASITFIDHLLKLAPPTVHLLLLGRNYPPLALAALRVRQQLLEFTAADLRFQQHETLRFFQQALGAEIGVQVATMVGDQIEGWAAGLRLVAMSYDMPAHHPDQTPPLVSQGPAFLTRFQWQTREFLLSEVLATLPPVLTHFLLQTAVLDLLTPELCDAVRTSGAAPTLAPPLVSSGPWITSKYYLEELYQHHFFTTRLAGATPVYRYHALFREALLHEAHQRYGSQQIATWRRVAAHWLAEQGQFEESLQLALAAEDFDFAATLVEGQTLPLIKQGCWHTLEQWLQFLPPQVIERRPALLLSKAWNSYLLLRINEVNTLLQKAEPLLRSQHNAGRSQQELEAEVAIFRSQLFFYHGRWAETIHYATLALQQLTPTQDFEQTALTAQLALCELFLDRREQAFTIAQNFWEEGYALASKQPRFLPLGILCVQTLDLNRLAKIIDQQQVSIPPHNWPEREHDWTHGLLCYYYYQRNELASAIEHALYLYDARLIARRLPLLGALYVLTMANEAQGCHHEADHYLQTLLAYIDLIDASSQRREIHSMRAAAHAMSAYLLWQRHSPATGLPPSKPLTRYDPTTIPAARVLFDFNLTMPVLSALEAGQEACAEVESWLIGYLPRSQSTIHTTREIEALALYALLQETQGRHVKALTTLTQALTLAQPSGALRIFVDLGPNLADLLQKLLATHTLPAPLRIYAERILQLYTQQQISQTTRHQRMPQVNRLTKQERRVIELLNERLTNQEIAKILTISTATVRHHLENIFPKLGVDNRRQAVVRAKELNILPQQPKLTTG